MFVVLSHLALYSKYWSQKLSKAADGSTILTTSYRFPSSMTLDKQPTPDNCKFIKCLQMQTRFWFTFILKYNLKQDSLRSHNKSW